MLHLIVARPKDFTIGIEDGDTTHWMNLPVDYNGLDLREGRNLDATLCRLGRAWANADDFLAVRSARDSFRVPFNSAAMLVRYAAQLVQRADL